jgi:DNA-binding protein H-NS
MTQTNLSELLAQKAALEQQIADVQRAQRSEAVAKVKSLMAEYGLTLADLNGASPRIGNPGKKPASKVAAKYINQATGETWSGRGLKPKWLTAALSGGGSLADFAV